MITNITFLLIFLSAIITEIEAGKCPVDPFYVTPQKKTLVVFDLDATLINTQLYDTKQSKNYNQTTLRSKVNMEIKNYDDLYFEETIDPDYIGISQMRPYMLDLLMYLTKNKDKYIVIIMSLASKKHVNEFISHVRQKYQIYFDCHVTMEELPITPTTRQTIKSLHILDISLLNSINQIYIIDDKPFVWLHTRNNRHSYFLETPDLGTVTPIYSIIAPVFRNENQNSYFYLSSELSKLLTPFQSTQTSMVTKFLQGIRGEQKTDDSFCLGLLHLFKMDEFLRIQRGNLVSILQHLDISDYGWYSMHREYKDYRLLNDKMMRIRIKQSKTIISIVFQQVFALFTPQSEFAGYFKQPIDLSPLKCSCNVKNIKGKFMDLFFVCVCVSVSVSVCVCLCVCVICAQMSCMKIKRNKKNLLDTQLKCKWKVRYNSTADIFVNGTDPLEATQVNFKCFDIFEKTIYLFFDL